MRAPTATNNELVGILGIAAFIAAAIIYFQTPTQPVVVVQQPVQQVPVKPPPVVLRPANWGMGGMGPGWASGRWLGEGDFKHFGQMDHPFRDGHPPMHMQMPELPTAPLGSRGRSF